MSGPNTEPPPPSDAFSRLKFWNLLIDTFVKVVSPLGLLIAALVAFGAYRDRIRSADEAARLEMLLEMHVEATHSPVSESDSDAVVVTISLLNRGTRTLKPYWKKGCDNGIAGEGCTISITRHKAEAGPSSDPKEPLDPLIPFNGDRVKARTNILSPRYDYGEVGSWHRRYGLLPNTEYREREALILESGYVYEIVSRFYIENPADKCDPHTVSETTFLYLPSRKVSSPSL